MKRILVTNDDGINAEGIRRLVAALGSIEDTEVYVVAPKEQQSAKSQSITFRREVTVEETDLTGADRAYAVDGTPTDCVKIAIVMLEETGDHFDYLFSGINMGANTGSAAYYSGTVSAAVEGALNGIRSIAMSVMSHEAANFDYICGMIPSLIEMSGALTARTVLSVNAPDMPVWEVRGARIVPMAPFRYGENFTFVKADSGNRQLIAAPTYSEDGLAYDFDCVGAGYAAISPISIDIADRTALAKLHGIYHQEDILTVSVDAQERNVAKAY